MDSAGTLDQDLREDGQQALEAFGAKYGHFAYESGFHSDLFLNLDKVIGNPSSLGHSVDALCQLIRPLNAQVICGPLSGGAFLAYAIASKLSLRFCWSSRASPDSGKAFYAFDYHVAGDLDGLEGRKTVIVDDAIGAGSAIRGTIEDLHRHGLNVVGVASLITTSSAAESLCRDKNIPLFTLKRLETTMWEPQSCPLCHRGDSITDIG